MIKRFIFEVRMLLNVLKGSKSSFVLSFELQDVWDEFKDEYSEFDD